MTKKKNNGITLMTCNTIYSHHTLPFILFFSDYLWRNRSFLTIFDEIGGKDGKKGNKKQKEFIVKTFNKWHSIFYYYCYYYIFKWILFSILDNKHLLRNSEFMYEKHRKNKVYFVFVLHLSSKDPTLYFCISSYINT